MIRRLLPGPVIVLAILILFTFWLDQSVQQPKKRYDTDQTNNPDYIIENLSGIQMVYDQSAERHFTAKILKHYPTTNVSALEQVHFINTQPNEPTLKIKADSAELSRGNEDIYLFGNVNVVRGNEANKDIVTMVTDSLHLVPDQEIVKTDQPVTITKMNTIVNAVGMQLNNKTGVIELHSKVKARDVKL